MSIPNPVVYSQYNADGSTRNSIAEPPISNAITAIYNWIAQLISQGIGSVNINNQAVRSRHLNPYILAGALAPAGTPDVSITSSTSVDVATLPSLSFSQAGICVKITINLSVLNNNLTNIARLNDINIVKSTSPTFSSPTIIAIPYGASNTLGKITLQAGTAGVSSEDIKTLIFLDFSNIATTYYYKLMCNKTGGDPAIKVANSQYLIETWNGNATAI